MRIISKKVLRDFYGQYPDSEIPLESWYKTVKHAQWTCFADIKETFNSVDYVGNKRYVFNVKGNDYRIVAILQFTIKAVLIRFVGTHPQYDKIEDIKNI
ncbi:MAG: addiction module toxin RelE [Bacteroidia bacterium 44-10]|jgi:mRNA interferase HigB|nr:MAG: addiction module toxin RelE [Bacteroidia bacterium 44-10]